MGCLGKYKTYLEYAMARDAKKAKSAEKRKNRKWYGIDKSNRRKILWQEAKQTGILFGRPISEVIYNRYSKSAQRRKIEFNISYETFIAYWKLPCYYCGSDIETIGIDRVNNDKGYENNNIVPCCTKCNLAKRKMSDIEYIEHCKLVAAKHSAIKKIIG